MSWTRLSLQSSSSWAGCSVRPLIVGDRWVERIGIVLLVRTLLGLPTSLVTFFLYATSVLSFFARLKLLRYLPANSFIISK